MILDILNNFVKPLVEPAAGKILQNVATNYILNNTSESKIGTECAKQLFSDNSSKLVADVITSGINNIIKDQESNNITNSNTELDLYELAKNQKYDKSF